MQILRLMGSRARESPIVIRSNVSNSGAVHSATLAAGTFPGPIIAGTKVTFMSQEDDDDPSSESLFIQGAEFSINVIDRLNNTDLDLGTSIVRSPFAAVWQEGSKHLFCSIGTVFFNITQTMLMVLPLLPNVPSYRMRVSYTNSMH